MPPEVFIRRMLTTPIFFDRFEDLITMHTSAEEEVEDSLHWLKTQLLRLAPLLTAVPCEQCAEELSFGEGKVTYLQLLLLSVDPESFSKEVLPLFQDSASDLVHAKVPHALLSEAFFIGAPCEHARMHTRYTHTRTHAQDCSTFSWPSLLPK
jgi:hypothetical protein